MNEALRTNIFSKARPLGCLDTRMMSPIKTDSIIDVVSDRQYYIVTYREYLTDLGYYTGKVLQARVRKKSIVPMYSALKLYSILHFHALKGDDIDIFPGVIPDTPKILNYESCLSSKINSGMMRTIARLCKDNNIFPILLSTTDSTLIGNEISFTNDSGSDDLFEKDDEDLDHLCELLTSNTYVFFFSSEGDANIFVNFVLPRFINL